MLNRGEKPFVAPGHPTHCGVKAWGAELCAQNRDAGVAFPS